jgi:hypothetical protein
LEQAPAQRDQSLTRRYQLHSRAAECARSPEGAPCTPPQRGCVACDARGRPGGRGHRASQTHNLNLKAEAAQLILQY